MSLPETDLVYLKERAITFEVTIDAGMICVVFKDYQLPVGYDHSVSDLMLRLSTGYPDVQPDMWWFSPGLKLRNGQIIPQTETIETLLNKTWQRWSRHLDSGRWRSGTDSLETYLAVLRSDLMKYSALAA